MRLVCLASPRTLVLVSDTHCLLIRAQSGHDVVCSFLERDQVDLAGAAVLSERIHGCLGLLSVAGDIFLPVISSATSLFSRHFSSGAGAEPIARVLAVDFYCLTSDAYESDYGRTPTLGQEVPEHPCAGIRRLFAASSFYYSSDPSSSDISTRLETKLAKDEDVDGFDDVDTRFIWNSFMASPLLAFRTSLATATRREEFDRQRFLVLAIQGYCGVSDISLGGQLATLSLISRIGWANYGTRFNSRGVDDEAQGNVANFVETETILRTANLCLSFVQVRGSVPLFWEEGAQPFGKITVTRPQEASLPAFLRHFESLIDAYKSLHLVNLLSSKDQEALLTDAYESHLREAKRVDEDIRERVEMTNFDFHARSRIGGIESVKSQLASAIGAVSESFGSCLVGLEDGEKGKGKAQVLVGQRGVFRTNCKDCLDRTNVVEDVLSRFALEDFVRNMNPDWAGRDAALWSAHMTLFAENGDALSRLYVGTNAINSSFTREGKKSFSGLLSDMSKSVGRLYQSNFVDGSKQTSIELFLGHLSTSEMVRAFDPVNDAVREALEQRAAEFTTNERIVIWVGTFNLNGKGPGSESLLPWLFPQDEEPTFLVIGFQEIVPLSVQQIMATDPAVLRSWESHILQTVATRPGKKADYVLLRSAQLVGTALLVLVKTSLTHEVRNVAVAVKKTGLRGLSGNKGAVAIRLEYKDTSFCFLTAHLAAGHSNVEERHADYATITSSTSGLHFARGKTIQSHDNIIWALDSNYRISLPNETVRQLAQTDDYAALLEADQLVHAMQDQRIFVGYSEGPLLFRPTYKYDNNSDEYDTSEKQRIPAWTDRILTLGRNLDINRYQRVELRASDHRPVYALLRAEIRKIDHTKRGALRQQLQHEIAALLPVQDLNSQLVGLPLPSSETSSWWDTEKLPIAKMGGDEPENPLDEAVPSATNGRPVPPPRPAA